ncbi:MAG: ATP-binding protein [Candidatus Promineifilaceae bacterium]
MTSFRPRRVGLFVKLMGAFLVVIITVAVLITWLASRATQVEFSAYTNLTSQNQAEVMAPLLAEYYLANSSWDGVEAALAATRPSTVGRQGRGAMGQGMMAHGALGQGMMAQMDVWQMTGTRALVADANGTVVADSAGELDGLQLTPEDLDAGVPIYAADSQVGTILVTTWDQSIAQNEQFLRQVNRAILVAVLIASGIALVIGSFISWQISRPLRQLTEATEAIAEGDLSRRVEVHSGDELGDLAQSFNQMSDRLQRAENLRQQMTADIAHELRTPIAVIQGNVDALQDGIFPLTPEALDPIRDKTSLLTRLVDDLRELALMEAGQLKLDRQQTDLNELVIHTVGAFRAAAQEKSIDLRADVGGSLPPAYADPQRVEQILVNLLSNALRHTPHGGEIVAATRLEPVEDRAGTASSALMVTIQDSGPGIPPEDLPNVFERFYRVEKGRTRPGDGSGTGLGLAVARSIVEAHRGEIGVKSLPGQGATFWFTLPTR